MHAWLFRYPRENAILPIASTLIGNFSWSITDSRIYCNRLLQVKPTTDLTLWSVWTRLLFTCNEMYAEEYRQLVEPFGSAAFRVLDKAIKRFRKSYTEMKPGIEKLIELGIRDVGYSYAIAESYLLRAEVAHMNGELQLEAAYLESVLSSLHDMLTVSMPEMLEIA